MKNNDVWFAVSLLLVACGPAEPSGGPFEASGELSVLSYNVHGLPDLVTGVSAPGVERMTQISPLLNGYDLLGLQEVFTPENREAVLEQVEHPLIETFNTPIDSSRVYGAGLEVLSRVGEHVGTVDTFYEACHGMLAGASDCLASKGFQAVTLDLGGALVTFMNTHHEAGGGKEDEAARGVQVGQVLDALAALPEDHAVIYVGDFNMRESDPADVAPLQAYADAGLRNLCVELDCAEPDRIDRIHVRDSSVIEWTPIEWWVADEFVDAAGEDLSDHDAIAGRLRWDRR
ncbi:MAG: endonuclease/exonuclease/phosphatase family protein [Myxococcota bacterium]